MTPDEGVELGQRILDMTTVDTAVVFVTHTARNAVRIANGRVLGGDEGGELQVELALRQGQRDFVRATVDQRDDGTLRAAVDRAEFLARQAFGEEVNLDAEPIGPQQYTPVTLWHESTAHALDHELHDVVPAMLTSVANAGLRAAGFVGGIARTKIAMYKSGLVARCRETDVECTMTVRAPDGTSSGWAGQASRDWRQLDPDVVTQQAIELSQRAANPVGFEPGRRMAILGPTAVAQIVRTMAYAYGEIIVESGGSPLSKSPVMGGNRLGERVFDERIGLVSDPADPEGGYPPFYHNTAFEFSKVGIPVHRIQWAQRGVLQSLAYEIGSALAKGRQHHMAPTSVRLFPEEGTTTHTLDEMIAGCDLGIYVNRFSNLRVADYQSGMLTGVTRDGCFLIKNGKIEKSVKNFRISDSPFMFFNRLEAIGAPERAAFGFGGSFRTWPLSPVIAPPMMVQDFNFSALSDAV